MNKAPRSGGFKLKLFTGIFLALAAVIAVSFISYRSVSNLVATLKEESKPNQKLSLLSEIMSDLSNAESGVRTYTITRDAAFLSPYMHSVSSVEDKFVRLYALNKDESQRVRLDSINALINEKYEVFNELILLQPDERVEDVLSKIIQKISAREKEAVTEKEQQKLSKLKESFRQKKDRQAQAPGKEDFADLQKMVKEIKRQEVEKAEADRKRELELTIADAAIMNDIRFKVDEITAFEVASARMRAEKAERLANFATVIITVIAITAFLLVLSLTYLILSFVSRTTKYNKEMKQAKEHAEKSARAKEDFLASISHEIRTPMNAILGFSEQLEKTQLDSNQKLYTGTIKDSIEHLLVVVNDVLDHSKLESGTFAFENIGFRPVDIIRNVLESFRRMAQEKGLTLRFETTKNIPDILIGDPHRLKQILYNLIGNAIKFTEEGFIEIKAKPIPKESGTIELQIEVVDSGIGIPSDKIENIFEDFYQLDSTNTRKYGGTGLGLAITKRLVEMQNGNIQVRSEKGAGSVFSFTIPYHTGAEIDLEEKIFIPADPSKFLGDISALVVDDEKYNRMLLETILTRWGTQVTLCDGGKVAIEELEKNNYDIVLMDVRMPEMSGLEATERIRNLKSGSKSQVPILALTAAGNEQDIKTCKMAGMNDFLSKPFREAELFEKMCAVLHIDFSRSHALQTELMENGEDEKGYNLTELKLLGNGDASFVNEMIRIFIQNTNDGMNRMKEAIQKKDWENAGLYAHRLAAPSRHLGMTRIVKKLKEIEANTHNKTILETIPPLFQSLEPEIQVVLEKLQQELSSLKSQDLIQ